MHISWSFKQEPVDVHSSKMAVGIDKQEFRQLSQQNLGYEYWYIRHFERAGFFSVCLFVIIIIAGFFFIINFFSSVLVIIKMKV